MRLPWIPIIIAVIAGILIAEVAEIPWQLAGIVLAIFVILSLVPLVLGFRRIAFGLVLPAFLLLGVALLEKSTQDSDSLNISEFIEVGRLNPKEITEFIGIIADHPDRRDKRIIIPVQLENARQREFQGTVQGRIRLTIYLAQRWLRQGLPFRTGDRIRFFARLRKPYSSRTPGTFDFATYLHRQGIDFLCHVKSPLAVEIVDRGHGMPFAWAMSALKNSLTAGVLRQFSDANGMDQRGALLSAMVLGNRGFIREETVTPLRRAGLMHIIAISGYHVWVAGLIVYALLSLLGTPLRWTYGATAAFLILYWAIAGGRSSVSRACIVALVFLISKLLYKRVYPLNNLGFAAFLIVLVNPYAPFEAGFQMTFAAAASIVIVYPLLMKTFTGIGWLGPPLAIALAAQLGVIPLVAWHFNTVNLHAAITGLLALPVVSLGIFAGFLYFIGLQFVPIISDIIAGFISLNFGILLELVSFFDDVLPLTIRMPQPPILLMFTHYVLLLGWTAYYQYRRDTSLLPETENPKIWSLLPFAATIALIAINPFAHPPTGAWHLHKLDVGQSSATVMEHPEGGAMLIDAGGSPMSDFDVGENVVSPFLWKRGHRRIDIAVATHSDLDHLEGFTAILRNFSVGELWLPLSAQQSGLLNEIELLAEQRGIRIRRFRRGEKATWRDAYLQILNPPVPSYRGRQASNNNSLIARMKFGRWSYLFTGDAEQRALDEIAQLFGPSLSSTIMEAPHHGSADALSSAFIDAAKPEAVLVSAGLNNSFGFPHAAVLNVLQKRNIPIYRTDQDGTISVTFTSKGMKIHSYTSDPGETN